MAFLETENPHLDVVSTEQRGRLTFSSLTVNPWYYSLECKGILLAHVRVRWARQDHKRKLEPPRLLLQAKFIS